MINDNDRLETSLSVQQFCAYENISKSTYFKVRNLGYGPREMRIPGTELIRITHKAREEWHERLSKLKPKELEQLSSEFARRSELSAAKGLKSGQVRNASKRGSYTRRSK